jgi:hypothetical protein
MRYAHWSLIIFLVGAAASATAATGPSTPTRAARQRADALAQSLVSGTREFRNTYAHNQRFWRAKAILAKAGAVGVGALGFFGELASLGHGHPILGGTVMLTALVGAQALWRHGNSLARARARRLAIEDEDNVALLRPDEREIFVQAGWHLPAVLPSRK